MAHILIIEDEEMLAQLYQMVFTKRQHMVDIAYDGEEGLVKAKSVNPEIILLDIMMPKMNGVNVLEHLKSDQKTKNIPVIVLSNLTENTIEQTMIHLGALRSVIKSQHVPDQIVDIVEETLKSAQVSAGTSSQ